MTRARTSDVACAGESRRTVLRSNLKASVADATAFGGMVGFGETYLVAFALAIGLSELTAGLVGSLPLVVGGLLQLASPRLIVMLGSHKRWVVTCAAVQALTFLPLLVAAYLGTISAAALLLVASLYWGAGLATGPAWNTWIATIVPSPIRSRYFAFRTRASQVAVFAGFLAGGLGLQYAETVGHEMTAFAILFGGACVCRFISVAMLAWQTEPTPIPANMKRIPLAKSIAHLRGTANGKLLLYLMAVQATAQMSGPYFTPFMFQKLGHSYGEYVTLISVAFLAKVLSLPMWGYIAHRVGPQRLLWVGGIGIAPLAMAWTVNNSVPWLICVQVAAGLFWAGYELAFFLLFFDSIPADERTSLLTLHNLINTIAFVSGAIVGGAILSAMGSTYTAYMTIFAVSSIGRAASLLLLARVPTIKSYTEDIGLRTMSVRLNSASLDTPVVASLQDDAKEPVEAVIRAAG